jgi:hypothetical protein
MILDDRAEHGDVIRRRPHVAQVLCGCVHRDVPALFAGTLMTAGHSTCRLSALRLHDAEPPVASPSRPASCCMCGTRRAA